MATDPKGGAGGGVDVLQIDEAYEFCAPRFFDFINEETKEDIRRAERWFETSLSYAPSPFMPKIKEGRSIKMETLCDFGNVDRVQKESAPAEVSNQRDNPMILADNTIRHEQELDVATGVKASQQQEIKDVKNSLEFNSEAKPSQNCSLPQQEISLPIGDDSSASSASAANLSKEEISSFEFPLPPSNQARVGASTPKAQKVPTKGIALTSVKKQVSIEACTPKVQTVSVKGSAPTSTKNLTAKKIASLIKQPSAAKLKTKSPSVQSSKCTKPKSVIKCPGGVATKNAMATVIAQENQAIKRQKLDDGRSRQILNVKTRVLPHKSRPGLTSGTDIFSYGSRVCHEDSSLRKEVTPFMSTAELVKKFQSTTRDLDFSRNRSLLHDDTAMIQRRTRLILTRPKEPALETAHRDRAVRVKSSAELEEEMLAKIPKFKARPVNKKILEAPSLPALPRTVPQQPEFQVFHLKTMERANQYAETSSTVSIDASTQNQSKPSKLTEPRPPLLETSLRARPPKVKSSEELELEELEKIPKFKARPLNKKILDSRGATGLFSSNPRPQITTPQEFHFATNDRFGPSATMVELFDKLSLHSESSHRDNREVSGITMPNPFHLKTEERGSEKERQFAMQIFQKQLEEERARIPKANPYPYTTDYPVIPSKPEPKQCTKPEAFQLESLVRHEEEMQRKLEEKERMQREEAQKRIFKAQRIMRDDPIPLPEIERRPLTEVQEFVFHSDHRAVQRSEFDKKIKEKEMMYKRMREEYETAKMIEEEKAVKQLRRTMVPHARQLPKFDNPFLPQKSTKETTKPKSPELRVNQRGERWHAFHMR